MAQNELVNTATDHGCFGCGEQNPIGLHLKFFRREGAVEARFVPRKTHEGYVHMMHGGIVSALLDEAMSWAVIDGGHLAVTAKMQVHFRKPVPVNAPLTVIGRVDRDRGRAIEASGELLDADGTLLASSSGVFMRVSEEQQRQWEATYLGRDDSAQN
ncbi:MAG: PaaI family thioesterase [Nitrolancea sp.]